MQKIIELDETIVNKIAAGEVIERTASVVKELVENAIDAEATRIEIDLEEGGQKRIRIVDNGYGMVDADLKVAFRSHSTSKLKSPDDLFRITTMGFRGEALPSIGSVSRARITTCFRGHSIGAEITMEGGRIGELMSKGAPVGTTVEVRDIFFNTPVRRKFMRSAAGEMKAVAERVGRMALAHTHIAFLLSHNGRRVFFLQADQTLSDRIGDLLTPEVADALIPIDYQEGGLSLSGYAVKPSVTRANGQGQYLYLNGRFIRDRGIQAALRTAYEGFLMVRRYPMAFLFIDIDPAAVDVNVHPTKAEVRFRDGQAVRAAVVRALRQALQGADLVAELAIPPAGSTDRSREEPVRAAVGDFLAHNHGKPQARFKPTERPEASLAPTASERSRFMQVHNLYILVETASGIRLVDQHALHEKILYTQLVRAAGAIPSQRLLVPEVVELTAAEFAGAEPLMAILGQEGFEIEPFGERALAIYALPQILEGADLAGLIREASGSGALDRSGEAREALYAMVACKAAVKAGMPLQDAEIVALLQQHAAGDLLDFCPHGRPAVLDLTLEQLGRQFGRI